jgi:hypothetical protein
MVLVQSEPSKCLGEVARCRERVPAGTGVPGEVGLEVHEHGAGDVGIAVLDSTRLWIGEVPADVEYPQISLCEDR